MNPIDLFNNEEKVIINEIVSFHRKSKQFPAACLVGSLVKGYFSETSDIDLLVFVNNNHFSLETYSSCVKHLKLNAKLKDDAYDFVIGNRNASLIYKSYPDFIKKINDIIIGKNVDIYYKEWACGGVIDDVLLLDVSKAIIFYDSQNELVALANYLKKQYPPHLKQAIIDSTATIITIKIKNILRFKRNPLISSIAVNELLVAYIRRMYAIYGIYNPGLKHVFSERNLDFLQKNIPELYTLYKLYNGCKIDNYEPLYFFIENHMEVE